MTGHGPLADLVAPVDPRRDLPALGSLPRVEDLGAGVTRVLADNPSPMTLDGTNTYLVGAPGSGEVAAVDPGPSAATHVDRLRATARARDAEIVAVLLTHHHRDHAEAAPSLAEALGCPVHAVRTDLVRDTRPLGGGDDVAVAGTVLHVVPTPGHAADHVAFRLEDGSLLVGDHVLGRGTSVVAAPDGDLADYLASLRRVRALGPDRLLPGHGPVLDEDPMGVVDHYLAHRAYRQAQVEAVLAEGPHTVREVVERLYADVPAQVWPAADASTLATLRAMRDQGLAVRQGDDHWVLA